MTRDPFWNHNTHFHPEILRHAAGAASALDVGCGEGLLTRRLAAAGVGRVVGLDLDPAEVARAEALADGDPRLTYVAADVLTGHDPAGHDPAGHDPARHDGTAHDLGTFDVVACIATLHHVDLAKGLTALRDLVAPGGVLMVVGLSRPGSALDLAFDLASVPVAAVARHVRGEWEHGSPVADPAETFGQVRHAAGDLMPGARVRRRLYWRYTLEWRRPA
ncbi:class I SAM-dependent methyltransferase [Antribacter gilvus]|uniref:class I SAM-dependent methyltransferase n=1 Tax=Antribacter gilvus TaxID=2304675 RepID=UPI000F799A8F|nr:class I SAM-dependent methyltransferase [Antribacter gilvus]